MTYRCPSCRLTFTPKCVPCFKHLDFAICPKCKGKAAKV